MNQIGFYITVVGQFKFSVRKTLLSDHVHVLSDITSQFHTSTLNNLLIV